MAASHVKMASVMAQKQSFIEKQGQIAFGNCKNTTHQK